MEATLAPVAPAQAVLYRYLTEAFSPPTANRLEYMGNMLTWAQAACEEMLETGEAKVAPPNFGALEAAIAASGGAALPVLEAEYTRLFVFDMDSAPCRLLESVQREGRLVGEATEGVSSQYLRFGLEGKEREADHLTTELEFLTFLTGTPVAEGKETERYRRARIKFLREHMLLWGPPLARKVRENTTHPLILATAGLLDWFLTAEAALKV